MTKIIKEKLTKRSAKAYAKMSGFENTGEVYLHRWDKRTQKKIDKILEELYFPKEVK